MLYDHDDTTIYRVMINHDDQYSIWPADRELPLGWQDAGKVGLRAEVLAYIEEVWTPTPLLNWRNRTEET